MDSIFQLTGLVQPILSMLNGTLPNADLDTTSPNATTTATAMPSDFTTLIAFLYSSAALRDYLKLVVLGSAFETLRRLYYSASSINIWDRFFITATFESEDDSFQWMMFWLSGLPEWRKFRDFTVSTSSLGLNGNSVDLDDSEDENDDGLTLKKKTRKVHYLPGYATSYRMWYKRRYMTISRVKEESRWYSDKSTLHITIMSSNRSILDQLILEAKKAWLAARQDTIDIYANEGLSGDWRYVSSRPQRSLKSIILDAGVKEVILDDAKDFLGSKQWYADRGIPFRRGYLLYGAPGSGKTSIIHSLAGELKLDIYIVSLSKLGLDDSTLNELISNLPERCIALMEDIDAAFTAGLTRDVTGTELEDPRTRAARLRRRGGAGACEDDASSEEDSDREPKTAGPGGAKDSRITLSGLLNALDGVSAQEGRLLFATTNRYTALDPALTRPGRMDIHVEFKLASRYQATELFKRFYLPDPSKAAGEKQETEAEVKVNGEKDGNSGDSGYSTSTKSTASASEVGVTGSSHLARAPLLSKTQVEKLAARFADAIPEREFSMASLQGFLMAYKTRPMMAVEEAEGWVKEKREQIERKPREARLRAEKARAKARAEGGKKKTNAGEEGVVESMRVDGSGPAEA
ncbi:P-loop containing nucleoside triphosphate hydrolase protein [Amylostereum chailletii]|nr:P-loop containing nucleoside triphosphate hydrolase protein [Amylostereum chailletii]